MRLLLVGNYGVGNAGDEALRDYFLTRFPEHEWLVVSAAPSRTELPRLPAGLRSLLRFRWWRTLRELKHCDALVFGGGTLFTDIESVKACWVWWVHAAAARFFGVPIVLAFQGVGPFRTKWGRRLARQVAGWAGYISLRDSLSVNRVESWNVNRKIIQSFDPVLLSIEENNSDVRTKKILIVIPRNNSDGTLRQRALSLIAERLPERLEIVLLQPDDLAERRVAETLKYGMTIPVGIVEARSWSDICRAVSRGDFVLTQRFHGALAAVAMDMPYEVLPQGTDDKLSSLCGVRYEQAVRLAQAGESSLRAYLVQLEKEHA